jgi:hypothetical protein
MSVPHYRFVSKRASRLRRKPLAVCLGALIAGAGANASERVVARPDGDFVVPVTNCDDSGPGSLRDVLASAVDGDHIAFAAGIGCNVVSLTSGPIVIANDANGMPFGLLDITGLGREELTIDGGNLDRVFVHDAGAGASLTLRNLKITHGRGDGDGGCVLAHGSIALSDVEISDCTAGIVSGNAPQGNVPVRGGGLYAGNGATLENSVVSGNQVYGGVSYAYGGGIFAMNAITLTASTISNNAVHSDGGGSHGGGIAAGDLTERAQATITLVSSIVTGNTADSMCDFCGVRGGGVWTYGNSTFDGGEISANGASSAAGYGTGGGLYFRSRYGGPPVTATVTGTHFHCNSADDSGGGIGAGGDLIVSRADIDCNTATRDGGGIELLAGNLTLTDSTLAGNVAMGRGGGIFLFGYGDVAATNSTISGNVATNGGAIGNTYGSLHLANSTIAFNQAFEHGGGVYQRYAYYPFELRSTIVAGNTGTDGPEDIWPPGMTVTGSNSLVVAAAGVELPNDTLSADPLLQPLTMNGGSTLTHALGEGSPAIDAGSNDAFLDFDQRGEGFARVVGTEADIGAFEVQPAGPVDEIFADGFEP